MGEPVAAQVSGELVEVQQVFAARQGQQAPFRFAGVQGHARRYERTHGHPPKNLLGRTLYRVSVAEGIDWARRRDDVEVLGLRPRYLPDVARHLLVVPGLREVVTWNLLLILRRRAATTAPLDDVEGRR